MPIGIREPSVSSCVFCRIIAGDEDGTIVGSTSAVLAIEPLRPHAPGHLLFIPRLHVPDATTDTELTGDVFRAAAQYLRDVIKSEGNILTSVGAAATQTVKHLHVHVIPRGLGDGLHRDWPWMREQP